MPKQEQKRPAVNNRREAGQVREVSERSPAEKAEAAKHKAELDAELDTLLDNIDEVLEESAEEFVRAYVQKGGQ